MTAISTLRTAVHLSFRARAAGILAVLCLAIGLGGPVGSASASSGSASIYGYEVHASSEFGWNVCTRTTEVDANVFSGGSYSYTPAGTVYAKAWVHDTRNSTGAATSTWSESVWAGAAVHPTGGSTLALHLAHWKFLNTYYPNEYRVRFLFYNSYNQFVAERVIAGHVESDYSAYSCEPPGGWHDYSSWTLAPR